MMRNTARRFGNTAGALAVQRAQAYASPEDFCAIFRDDADRLYTLALSLTASHKLAQQAFVAALQECRDGSTVFQEWAISWSRRAVIKSAIRLVDPIRSRPNDDAKSEMESIVGEMDLSAGWFLRLDPLERFAFVISVLEGYGVRECAALLNATPREVEQARVRALQVAGTNQNILPAAYVNHSEDVSASILSVQ